VKERSLTSTLAVLLLFAASAALLSGCGKRDREASTACKQERSKGCGSCCSSHGSGGFSSWSIVSGCSCYK
jgi:hypothetical protein